MVKINIIITAAVLVLMLACSKAETKKEPVNITDAKIRLYKDKIKQDPYNYKNYNNLAKNYLQKARETGNTEYYGKAEIILRKSLEIKPDSYIGNLLFAKTKLANHEFHKALEYAQIAIMFNPELSIAYGILGDAYLELHKLSKAENAYLRMNELEPSLDSYGRISNLFNHRNNYPKAIKYMKMAYESGLKNSSTPKVNLAWTQVMLGSIYLDAGMLDKAENYFLNALKIYDDYYLARNYLNKVR